jgi:hypothetical protein
MAAPVPNNESSGVPFLRKIYLVLVWVLATLMVVEFPLQKLTDPAEILKAVGVVLAVTITEPAIVAEHPEEIFVPMMV